MKQPTPEQLRSRLANLDRRDFVGLLAALAASYPLAGLADKRQQTGAENPETMAEPWLTLASVQQHLFPADMDSPGASDINALGYLRNMLDAPDMDKKERPSTFVALQEAEREQVLRTIEQSRAGERWLSLLLSYLLEALLSDPVYGGNPDGIGWQWLQYQPGFPRPPKDKMYYKLADNHRYRRTRA